jgi:hypothetical protein
MPIHVCPVCGARHEVSVVLHRLACGYALTCSPKCKVALAALARQRTLAAMAESADLRRRRSAMGED